MSSGSKTAFYVAIGSFWWVFLEKNFFFESFSDLEQKLFSLLAKLFNKVVGTALYVSIWTLWGEKHFFWKIRIFITLGHWANTFRFLVAKISIRLWKLHSKGPENHFQENLLFLKKKFCQFRNLSGKFLVFSQNFVSKSVKTALYETTKKLERICFESFSYSLSEFVQKTFCFSSEKIQRFRQTPFYVSGRILRFNFLLSTFLNIFELWAKIFFSSSKNLWAVVPKLHST